MDLRTEEQSQESPWKNTISFLPYRICQETPHRSDISQPRSEFPLHKKGTFSRRLFLYKTTLRTFHKHDLKHSTTRVFSSGALTSLTRPLNFILASERENVFIPLIPIQVDQNLDFFNMAFSYRQFSFWAEDIFDHLLFLADALPTSLSSIP